jgi:hypothetical protein
MVNASPWADETRTHLFDDGIVVTQIWIGSPVSRIRRRSWWSSRWIGCEEGKHLDVGEGSGLRVDDLWLILDDAFAIG